MQAITTDNRTTTMRSKGTAYCFLPAYAPVASALLASANRRSDHNSACLQNNRLIACAPPIPGV